MKKTRVLAVLLCVMMAMTILPAWQVAAEVTTYDSINDIVGKTMYVQREYDLTQSIAGQDSNLVTGAETYGVENGMTLNGGYARLIQALGWSPIADGRVAYFKAKVVDAFQALSVLWAGPAGSPARASVVITASGIVAGEGGISENHGVVPGSNWAEYLIVAESDEAWSLHIKNSATSNQSFDVYDDYVVIASPSFDDVTRAGGDKPRYAFVPKDQQVVSMRWEHLYPKYPGQETFTMPLSYADIDRCLAIHPDSGSVLLRGVRSEGVVVDGKVSIEILASYLGGIVADGENGAVVFKYAGSENTFQAEQVTVKDGKKCIDPKVFAEATDLFLVDEKGTLIISPYEVLGVSQREELRYGLDFFTDQV